MRKILLTLLCFTVTTRAFAQNCEEDETPTYIEGTQYREESRESRRCRRGQDPGYTSRDATVLSMMGWGFGLAIGIAALCALVENSEG